MRWPWVSRELLDEVRRQLAKSEAEREKLLDVLSEKVHPTPTPRPNVSVEEDRADVKQSKVEGYTTPFDSIGAKFDKVLTIDKAKFIARI